MKTIKLLTALPFILIGYPIGFIWESLSVGFFGGKSSVCKMGDGFAEDLAKRKAL